MASDPDRPRIPHLPPAEVHALRNALGAIHGHAALIVQMVAVGRLSPDVAGESAGRIVALVADYLRPFSTSPTNPPGDR